MQAQNLKKASIFGMIWVTIEKMANQCLSFIVMLVMARFLMPEDYGIVGMLAIFLAIANAFQSCGFGAALIQKQDRTEADYSTVFCYNLGVASLFYGILFFSAPYIASFYSIPELTAITQVVALGLIISALYSVHLTRLQIQLRFKTQSVLSILTTLVSGTIGITFAYNGYGPWALVFQALISNTFQLLITWYWVKWMPRLSFSRESFKPLFKFGSKVLCASIIDVVYQNLSTIIVGRSFGSKDVGLYARSTGFVDLPINTASSVLISVNYPILSRLQDDPERLIFAYRKLIRVMAFILLPLLYGILSIAEPMVHVLLGNHWRESVPLIQILCISAFLIPLTRLNLNLLYVKGRTDLILRLEILKKPVGFIILLTAAPFGILCLCLSRMIYDFIAFSFNCYYTHKILGYGMFQQLRDVAPIWINATIMAGIVFGVNSFINNLTLQFFCGILVGGISYLLGALLYREPLLAEGWKMLHPLLVRIKVIK